MKPTGETSLGMGRALLSVGNPAGAVQHFQSALREQSGNPEALAGLAWAHLHLGKNDEALEAVRALARTAPNWAETHRLRASVLWRQHSLSEAAEAASEAIRLSPTEDTGHWLLAGILRTEQNFKAALAACERGLQSAPGSAPLMAEAALNAVELEGCKPASRWAAEALRRNPESIPALSAAAFVALASGDRRRAQDLSAAVLRRNSRHAPALGINVLSRPSSILPRALFRYRYWRRSRLARRVEVSGLTLLFLMLMAILRLTLVQVTFLAACVVIAVFLIGAVLHARVLRKHTAPYVLSPDF